AKAQQIPQLIFRGEGKNLSAGFDFTDYQNQSEGDLALRFIRIEQLLQSIASAPALTIALAHGRNFGAGVDLFAACRLRQCTPDATFRMPGLKFGLVLGSRRFGELVGRDVARRILEQARTFAADEAKQIGFVHELIEQQAWPQAQAEASEAAAQLQREARAGLYEALCGEDPDGDLARLVRSAARPGLKRRALAYLGRTD